MSDTSPTTVALAEWGSADILGAQLTPADRVLAAGLRDTLRLNIIELRDGLRVEARGWIGVVRMESCTILVEPRLIDGHHNLIRLLDYVHRLDLMKRLPRGASFESDGKDLFDLLAMLLALACDEVLSVGVQADYTPQRDELSVLRGRLDVKAQVLQRWGRVDRLICEFEERFREIPENQWLLRALRLSRHGVKNAEVATFVRRIASTWEELCDDDPGAELPKPAITRTNHHYRHALNLAYLVMEGVTVSNVLRAGSVGGFSFMLNMSRLFEEFVSCLLEQIVVHSGIRVDRQATDRSVLWNPDAHRPFGHVRPDVLLVGDGGRTRLPVDAKYKDYDGKKLQPDDIYQATIYALALARVSVPNRLRTCVLLHPSVGRGSIDRQRVHVRVGDTDTAEVIAVGLPVAELLKELRPGDSASFAGEAWYSIVAGLVLPNGLAA